MSKKSYKKLQNRLYREIKRRLIAEQMRVQYTVYPVKVETLKTVQVFLRDVDINLDEVKMLAARKLCEGLINSPYISFKVHDTPTLNAYPDAIEIEAMIHVCRLKDDCWR